jgi:hypothetical protein
MVTRMTLTRAELVAAHMAMNFLWIEHGLERDPEAAPLLSALMKFYCAVRTWDGEDTVKLVCVAGENTRNKKQIGIEAAAAKAKVKREVLVHWKCFCRPPAESCSFCRGSGHLERWMPAKLLAYLKGGSFSIVARRKVGFWWKVPRRPQI